MARFTKPSLIEISFFADLKPTDVALIRTRNKDAAPCIPRMSVTANFRFKLPPCEPKLIESTRWIVGQQRWRHTKHGTGFTYDLFLSGLGALLPFLGEDQGAIPSFEIHTETMRGTSRQFILFFDLLSLGDNKTKEGQA